MSTPTEPTTPQPKPADAAGLLPLRAHGRYIRDGNDYAIADAYTESNALLLAEMLNRPLPTPHAVEAGVRELAVAQEIADWAQENKELFFRHPAHVAHIAAILARRLAAETVGECPDCRGTGIETCLITGGRAPCHCQPVDSFAVRAVQALLKERGINTAKPAPPAKSALEAAIRDGALALSSLLLFPAIRGMAAGIRADAERMRVENPLTKGEAALAALNAVLTGGVAKA